MVGLKIAMEYDPSLNIKEHPDVYPPSEDSILLIESLQVSEGEKVLEIGCGSGVVSVHCAKNGCEICCADINPDAVKLTQRNLSANGLNGTAVLSDVYSCVDGRFDTIVFNLPYLPTDDSDMDDPMLHKAWSGGKDGMGPLPELIRGSPEHLLPGGRIVVVVSSLMDQSRLDEILEKMEVKVLGELSLFFEKLRVLELRESS